MPPYFGKSADIPGLFGYSTVNKMIICNNSLDSSDSDRTLESAVIGELWICDNVGVNLRGTISPVTFLKNGNVTKLNVGKSFMRGYKVDMGGLVADRLELDSNSCRKGVILKNAKIGTVILADNFGADCTDLTEFFAGAKIDNLVIGNNAFANASIFTNMFKGAVIQNITIGDNFGASATTLDGIFSSLASDNFTVGRNFCVKATRIVNALQSAILGNTSVYEGTFLNSAHADYNYYITMLKTVTSGKYTNLDI